MAWGYKATITIDKDKCGVADTAGFVFPVIGTYDGTGSEPDLRQTGHNGNVTSTSGYDICFYSDANLTSKLNHEIESYNHETGAVIFWVNVGTLDVSADTVIYMAYGDAEVTTSQESTDTWDSNYKFVSHTDGDPITDSTSNALTMTKTNTVNEATGIVGKGMQLGVSGSYYTGTPVSDYLNITNNLTVEAWYKHTGTMDSSYVLCHGSTQTYTIIWDGWAGKPWALFCNGGTGDKRCHVTTDTSADTTNFHYMAFTFTTTHQNAYLDGSNETSADISATIASQDSYTTFGREPGGNYNPQVIVDELRISNTVRSASYITATYNSIDDPATFYAMGDETSLGGAASGFLSPNSKLW